MSVPQVYRKVDHKFKKLEEIELTAKKSVEKWNQELRKISTQPCRIAQWLQRLVPDRSYNSVLQIQLQKFSLHGF